MPHIIVEYSGNLKSVAWADVLKRLHSAALGMPELPLTGLRSRAIGYDDFFIADGKPENAFVHVTLRMGHGRNEEAKKRIADHIFGALCDCFTAEFDRMPLSLTLELGEIHPIYNYRKSNMAANIGKRP